jgi:hypothetical protein
MIKRLFIIVPLAVVGSIAIYSCAKGKTAEPPETCDVNKVYFAGDIQPLLNSNCAMSGCHDAKTAAEGVNLSNYTGVMKVVTAGNAANSELYKVLTASKGGKRMPPAPASSLTATQISMINTWISQGAKNNSCIASTTCTFGTISYSVDIKPIIDAKCTGGCHSPSRLDGGYDLSGYDGLKSAADNEALYASITSSLASSRMPKDGDALPDCDIKKIKAWVDAGAPKN